MTGPLSVPPLRILVVDDEPAMVGAVAALVGSDGHRVIAAYDGAEALSRFDGDRPDLVLLDLAMPHMDGLAVARALRARAQTPIIVVSGESDERTKVQALDAGADDYVTKPFGKQELLARIRAVWRRHRSDVAVPDTDGSPLAVDRERHEIRFSNAALPLTRVEYELLAAIVEARGKLVLHQDLLRAGWPEEHDPDPLWPKPHLARLRAKLRVVGAPVPISVRGVGYRIA
ncbi:MAG: response regulator transcription factor [Chloroflexota bacterium]